MACDEGGEEAEAGDDSGAPGPVFKMLTGNNDCLSWQRHREALEGRTDCGR